jgi:hypothetical protein
MKAKVSGKLSGTIVIASVSKKSFVANQEFDITDEQYWERDVQSAIKKGWITCVDSPKIPKSIKITNISRGSVSIPNIGVLRSGKSVDIKVADSKSVEILRLIDLGKVKLGDKVVAELTELDNKMVAHDPGERVLEENVEPAVTPKKKKAVKKTKKPDAVDDLLIDTSAPAIDGSDEKDDIKWVDAEETARRIASHPILSKKKSK